MEALLVQELPELAEQGAYCYQLCHEAKQKWDCIQPRAVKFSLEMSVFGLMVFRGKTIRRK